MENAIQKATQRKTEMTQQASQSVSAMLNTVLDREGFRKRFNDLLGKRAPQFVSSVVSLVNADEKLQQAFYQSPLSVVQAALKAATFDLPIDQNLGYAYIVPFNNKVKTEAGEEKRMEATFILGWKGMHQMALRSGVYKTISVVDVREGEFISYNRLTGDLQLSFVEDEDARASLPVIGCQEWAGLYPAVDVIQQLRNMKGWLIGNPAKKKTRRGIVRFITGWLSREQDRGGAKNQNRQTEQQARKSWAELARELEGGKHDS